MSTVLRIAIVAATALASLAAGPRPAWAQADQMSNVQTLMTQARTSFDQLDYEGTVKALDTAIGVLEARPTEEARKLLPTAYEMRARSRFGLGLRAEAQADFTSLLNMDPAYALTGQLSPRIVELFEAVLRSTVTQLTVSIAPPNAEATLDGVKIPTSGTLQIAVGDHTIAASRIGYKAASISFKAEAGVAFDMVQPLALERVSSVFTFVTSPPGVEIVIDGIRQGVTQPGPPPAEIAERAARAGLPASQLSNVLVVPEVQIGTHRLEFRKDCFVGTERRLTVESLDDYVIDPIRLEPAVATIAVKSSQPGTMVYLDGQQRGVAPMTISDVCEGPHLVELKSASGRHISRVDARTGQKIDIAGALRPAFALVSTSGQAALNADVRLTIERQLESAQSVTFFAPPADDANKALGTEKLPPDWLAFDANKRALGTSADIGAVLRRDLSEKLAKVFDAQGVASVTVPSSLNRNRLVVAVLGSGSGEPDVLEISLDNPETVNFAIGRLDRRLSFFRPSIGLTAVDVADIEGAVVVAVDGPSAKAGILPGDVVMKANAQPVIDAAALTTLLAGRKADEDLTLELKDKAGTVKRADVRVFMTPRLIGMNDQTLMVNRILVDLRARVQAPGDPVEDSVMRLNLAVALARVENWSAARLELQRVKLPDGPGVSNGTVQYLLGLASDRMGNRAEAEAAWRAAAASNALLTEDGPAIKELADARLAELQKRPAR
ncbi:MAG: hypothetical protein A3H97_08920 [Acidobacteria bacterium RIFCSPLOWO2_02_FULL_65_29]|nr:MAG: hypothetical protein A3H97_08920 [Acidobacteria bacterium RIFCSPLOWO2_02_FULL_65_29]